VKRWWRAAGLGLLLAAQAAAAAGACAGLPADYRVSGPLRVEDVESRALEQAHQDARTLPQLPLRPFGYAHARWQQFVAGRQPGDEIIEFRSGATSWRALAGRRGYARLRNGCLADIFLIERN
jgi:hypothetical protein